MQRFSREGAETSPSGVPGIPSCLRWRALYEENCLAVPASTNTKVETQGDRAIASFAWWATSRTVLPLRMPDTSTAARRQGGL